MTANRKGNTYLSLTKAEGVVVKAALLHYKQSRQSLDDGNLNAVALILKDNFSGGALVDEQD
jgi:hypothetical protein